MIGLLIFVVFVDSIVLKFLLRRRDRRYSFEIEICMILLLIMSIYTINLPETFSVFSLNRFYHYFNDIITNYFLNIISVDSLINYRIIVSIPVMIIISYEDILSGWVFDEDVFSGIIINIILVFGIFFVILCAKYIGYVDKIQLNMYYIGCLEYLNDIVFSMAAMFVVTGIISISANSLGMGDVFYFTFVASFVDIYGAMIIFFLSYILAMIYCCIVISKLLFSHLLGVDKNISLKSIRKIQIKFTPFITMATLLFLCVSNHLMYKY